MVQPFAHAGKLQRLIHVGDQLVHVIPARPGSPPVSDDDGFEHFPVGAGSVSPVSARPAFARTPNPTSGKLFMILSCS